MAKRLEVALTGVVDVPRGVISEAVRRLFKNEVTLGAGASRLSARQDARVKAISHYDNF